MIDDRKDISLRAAEATTTEERKTAVESLRKFLTARERPRLGVSDEELEAAILEALRSERPNYRQMP
jgi:CO dehydrogenase/acetyl-CoA synthase beta subunit